MWVTGVTWSMCSGPSEDAADFGDERCGRARFRDEPVAAGACGALQLAGSIVRGERYDRNVRGPLVALEAARRFPAIEHRQAEIHQHDVREVRNGVRERVGAVARFNHIKA